MELGIRMRLEHVAGADRGSCLQKSYPGSLHTPKADNEQVLKVL